MFCYFAPFYSSHFSSLYQLFSCCEYFDLAYNLRCNEISVFYGLLIISLTIRIMNIFLPYIFHYKTCNFLSLLIFKCKFYLFLLYFALLNYFQGESNIKIIFIISIYFSLQKRVTFLF